MDTKNRKKEEIRAQIIKAAKIYSKELAGKTFLYVYGDEYFEILFKTDRFMHLTGVDSKISAKRFYNYSKDSKLSTSQFFFSNKHPYANARKKLPCLAKLPELTKSMVCVLKDISTLTVTYKIGLTNLEFTLGLTENIDFDGNKINDYFLPMTLRVKDKAIENSSDGEFVDFIFVKDAASSKPYEKLIYSDEKKNIPDSVSDLISPNFYCTV